MSRSSIDPVTLEVLRSAMPAVCEEMAVVLRRAAYNMFIYEIQDYSVALINTEGELLGQNRGGIPLFLGDLGPIIRSGVEDIGRENFFPGDVILMNEASICGQHLNNVVVYTPIFYEDQLVAFAVSRGHWMDIGGSKMGLGFSRTLDVFQEGLQFRNLKAYEAGKPNHTLFQIIKHNLRRPDLALGDLRALIGSCRLGEKRFLGILQKYGLDTVLEAVRIIADQAEERTRNAIAKIPDGVYEAESFLDNDGINMDETIPIKVRVIIEGTEMTIDYSEMGKQVQGPVNSGCGALITARTAVKILTSPADDANEGHFRPLKIIAPPGTFVTAKLPAAIASWSIGLSTVLDTIFKALAQAIPNLIPAGHKADQGDFGFYGLDESTGKYWFCGNIRGGGHGGRPHEDGESASVNILQGEITTAPVEEIELKYPLFVESYRLIQDSGGAGKFRGGLGTEWHIRPFGVDHVFVNIGGERYKCPPWGLWGGKEGMPNHYVLDPGDGTSPEVVTKRPGVRLPKEGSIKMRAGGGGGWGDNLERDPERVLTDFIRGYVSPEKVKSDYGVVIDPAEKRVDEEATRALREKMRLEREKER
jgi:N-methylhydantoinase B